MIAEGITDVDCGVLEMKTTLQKLSDQIEEIDRQIQEYVSYSSVESWLTHMRQANAENRRTPSTGEQSNRAVVPSFQEATRGAAGQAHQLARHAAERPEQN